VPRKKLFGPIAEHSTRLTESNNILGHILPPAESHRVWFPSGTNAAAYGVGWPEGTILNPKCVMRSAA
jgi:hypothetical protein